MPCYKCSNGKWRIGEGKCMYKTKANCEKALAAYYASRRKAGWKLKDNKLCR
jgi:hypothetical protein